MKMEAAGSCKTFIPSYQTTYCHVSKDHNINISAIRSLNFIRSGDFAVGSFRTYVDFADVEAK
jgi:hypothetical protein